MSNKVSNRGSKADLINDISLTVYVQSVENTGSVRN